MKHTSFSVGDNQVEEQFKPHGEKSCPPGDEEHDTHTQHGSCQAQPHVVVLTTDHHSLFGGQENSFELCFIIVVYCSLSGVQKTVLKLCKCLTRFEKSC